MDPPTNPFEETSFMDVPFLYSSCKIRFFRFLIEHENFQFSYPRSDFLVFLSKKRNWRNAWQNRRRKKAHTKTALEFAVKNVLFWVKIWCTWCKSLYAGDESEAFASGANDVVVVQQSDGSLKSTAINVQVRFK